MAVIPAALSLALCHIHVRFVSLRTTFFSSAQRKSYVSFNVEMEDTWASGCRVRRSDPHPPAGAPGCASAQAHACTPLLVRPPQHLSTLWLARAIRAAGASEDDLLAVGKAGRVDGAVRPHKRHGIHPAALARPRCRWWWWWRGRRGEAHHGHKHPPDAA
jgi:hypothetical protein